MDCEKRTRKKPPPLGETTAALPELLQNDTLDVHDVSRLAAVQVVEADLVDISLPEGLVRQVNGHDVVFSIGRVGHADGGVRVGVGDVARAEEQVGDVVAIAVGGGKHVGDLNGLVPIRRQRTVVDDGDVGILPLDREGQRADGLVVGNSGVAGGDEVGGALGVFGK